MDEQHFHWKLTRILAAGVYVLPAGATSIYGCTVAPTWGVLHLFPAWPNLSKRKPSFLTLYYGNLLYLCFTDTSRPLYRMGSSYAFPSVLPPSTQPSMEHIDFDNFQWTAPLHFPPFSSQNGHVHVQQRPSHKSITLRRLLAAYQHCSLGISLIHRCLKYILASLRALLEAAAGWNARHHGARFKLIVGLEF